MDDTVYPVPGVLNGVFHILPLGGVAGVLGVFYVLDALFQFIDFPFGPPVQDGLGPYFGLVPEGGTEEDGDDYGDESGHFRMEGRSGVDDDGHGCCARVRLLVQI